MFLDRLQKVPNIPSLVHSLSDMCPLADLVLFGFKISDHLTIQYSRDSCRHRENSNRVITTTRRSAFRNLTFFFKA